MKYCPYCGVVLTDGAASFCADCGESLPSSASRTKSEKASSLQTHPGRTAKSPKPKKEPKKRPKNAQTENQHKKQEYLPADDDGYDGYYDDVSTDDNGYVREGPNSILIKRIILLCAGLVIVISLAILAMYFL